MPPCILNAQMRIGILCTNLYKRSHHAEEKDVMPVDSEEYIERQRGDSVGSTTLMWFFITLLVIAAGIYVAYILNPPPPQTTTAPQSGDVVVP